MARTPTAQDTPVLGLTQGLEVLDCHASARRPLEVAEVAQLTGIAPRTVGRLVATLVRLGHLRAASEGAGHELAAGVVRLAEGYLVGIDVRQQSRRHVVALAEACSASSFLGVRLDDEMLVVEAARSRSALALLGSDIGTRMDIGTSALGRAWLAGVDAPTRQAVLARFRDGPAWLRGKAGRALDLALADAAQRGYALSLGEWHPNINSAAVPIRTPGGEVVSMNCGGPAFLIPKARLEAVIVPRLLRAAAAFARDIGGVSGPALTQAALPPRRVRARTAASRPAVEGAAD
ncbi:MAG: helix-turn-helix domain-containing protein [Burkholderiales bacterium]|nr:helix-turn-helix domain-containing protein [Burkholderiales bacterium]